MPHPYLTRRPGLLFSAFSDYDDEMRTYHLAPFMFAPCKWIGKDRFTATGFMPIGTAGRVCGSEMDKSGKPRLFDVSPGDVIVRGDNDMLAVLTAEQFKIMCRRLRARYTQEVE